MKIGFIGLGIMGRPMALNLIKGGHTVTVWARRAESMQPLLEAGAIAAASPAEAARGNSLVISMVADAPDVREVMLGEQGVVRAAAPGLVAVDMSTIAPAAARSIGADLAKAGIDTNRFPLSYVKAALDTCHGKLKTFAELGGYAGFYFTDEISWDTEAAAKGFTAEGRDRLRRLRNAFGALPEFTALHLEACLKNLAGQLGVKVGALVHPARLACTGKTVGPSLYHLLEVLGRDKVFERVDRALAWNG